MKKGFTLIELLAVIIILAILMVIAVHVSQVVSMPAWMRLAASFGGGIGRMRQTCGAACGMFLLAGLENGSAIVGDAEGKKNNYALVQDLAAQFKAQNGSLICAELLGIAPKPQDPMPEARTDAYYQKRPCIEMIESAVRIFLTTLHHSTQ